MSLSASICSWECAHWFRLRKKVFIKWAYACWLKGSFIKVSQCNPASIYSLDHVLVLIKSWIHEVWAKFWAGSKSRLTAVSLGWSQLGFRLRLWLRLTAQTHASDHWLGLLTHRIGHWIAGLVARLLDWCRLRLNNLVLIKRVYSQKRESLSNPLFFGITAWLSGRIHRHTLHLKCKWPSGLLFVSENRPSCLVASLHQWLCYILHALLQLFVSVASWN